MRVLSVCFLQTVCRLWASAPRTQPCARSTNITHNLYVGPSHHSALLWHAMRRHRRERIWESSTYGVRTHSSRIHLLLIHVSCLTEWINGGGATARCCTEHVSGSTRRRGWVCVRADECVSSQRHHLTLTSACKNTTRILMHTHAHSQRHTHVRYSYLKSDLMLPEPLTRL